MRSGWKTLPFTEVIADETGGNVKTLQSEFLPAGRFPIVDQGKDLVAGYTNDPDCLCKSDTPVIIFGDHTKCLKYVDFPFCLGADGTKVLRPSIDADEKYLFYFLQTLFIPEAGYSRHFKYLKQAEITLPPLQEQKRIAAILDQADNLRRLRQRAIDRLNSLGQAIFSEMFGEPSSGPKGWRKACVSDICDRVTVGVVVKPASYYQETGIPAIRGTNIKESGIDLSDVVFFSEADNATRLAKTRVWEGDLVIVRSGRPGLAAVVPAELNGANAIDVIIATPIQSKIRPRFFRDLVNAPEGRRIVLSESRGQVQQHFNVKSFSKAEIYLPPMDVQRRYEHAVDHLETQHKAASRSSHHVERLFRVLQHRAFRGEL